MEPAFYTPQQKRAEDHGALFARPTKKERREARLELRGRMLPMVLALALKRGAEGITPSEVASEAMVPSLVGFGPFLTIPDKRSASYNPRRDSWIGPWLSALGKDGTLRAKMVRVEGRGEIQLERPSTRDGSHGNPGLIYLHPEVAG